MIQEQQLKDAFRMAERRIAALEGVLRKCLKIIGDEPIGSEETQICLGCGMVGTPVEHKPDCLFIEGVKILGDK